MSDHLRLPPHSDESEQAVLGALLADSNAFHRITLSPDDFYRHDHRVIFRAIAALCAEDKPADVVTVAEWLDTRGDLDAAGGLQYLAGITKDTPSIANLEAYAQIVAGRARTRHSITFMGDAIDRLFSGEDVDGVVSELQGALEGMTVQRSAMDFREVLQCALTSIEQAAERREKGIEGITTGLPSVDRVLGGIHGPKLVVIAARPSLGKTALKEQIKLRAASRGYPVGSIELETGPEEVGLRNMALAYQQNFTALAHADPEALAAVQALAAKRNIRDYPIYLDDSAYRLPEIISRITEWHRRYKTELAFIDNLQNITTPGQDTRNNELGQITRSLKRLAKKLHHPIILLSHINRDPEKHGRRPTKADLRDSGEIEGDADIIIALNGDLDQDEDGNRDVEIGFLKHRGGRVGWLSERFQFQGRTQRFVQLTADGFIQRPSDTSRTRPTGARSAVAARAPTD